VRRKEKAPQMTALLLLFDVDGTLWDETSDNEANNAALKELWDFIENLKTEGFRVTVAYNTGRDLERLQDWAEYSELKEKDFAITSQGLNLSAQDPALKEKLDLAWGGFKKQHVAELPPPHLTEKLIEYRESRMQGKALLGQNLNGLEEWCRENKFEFIDEEWECKCWETGVMKKERRVTLIPEALFRAGCRAISKGVAAYFLYQFWRRNCLDDAVKDVGVIWAGDGDNDAGMVGLWAGVVPPVHDESLEKAITDNKSSLRTHVLNPPSAKKASALSVLDGLKHWVEKKEELFQFTKDCGEGMLSEAVQQWWDLKETEESSKQESMAQKFADSVRVVDDDSMPGLPP
jgi:hydroxymethylpyrimidine pyrophosphatase-like HAD family hydrolase